MDIQTAAHYLKNGYRIRRQGWREIGYAYTPDAHHISGHGILPPSWTIKSFECSLSLSVDDLLADDWEVITEGIVKDFPITYSD